jgi:hypothetical protein
MRLICPMPPRTKRWRSRWEHVHLPLDSERQPIRGARLKRDQGAPKRKGIDLVGLCTTRVRQRMYFRFVQKR